MSVLREGTEVVNGVTDGDGKVKFDQLDPGTYSIVVASQGFDTLASTATLAANATSTVTLDLHIPRSPTRWMSWRRRRSCRAPER